MRRALFSLLMGLSIVTCLPTTLAAQTSSAAGEPRGDVAIGYAFMHETGLALPSGFTLSDSWRANRNLDLVVETQFEHGSVGAIGVNIFGVLGGIRGSGSSRYGNGTTAFGQVLAGLVRGSASVAFQSAGVSGFGVQPGFGVEVPMTPKVALRPQFDVLITRISGGTTKDIRFNVNVVFRLFKK
jgi:hypothetical protein